MSFDCLKIKVENNSWDTAKYETALKHFDLLACIRARQYWDKSDCASVALDVIKS